MQEDCLSRLESSFEVGLIIYRSIVATFANFCFSDACTWVLISVFILSSAMLSYQYYKQIPYYNSGVYYSEKDKGKFKISESKEFYVSALKSALRGFNGATINDLAWAVLTRALKKYLDKRPTGKVTSITGMMGNNVRLWLNKGEMGNESFGNIIGFKVSEEGIDSHLKYVQSVLKRFKNKVQMKSALYFWNFLFNFLVEKKSYIEALDHHQAFGFIFSNIQGPKEKIYICGREVYDFHPVLPHGNIPFTLLAFSYKNKLKFCFDTDRCFNLDTDEIVRLLESEIDEFINVYS